MATTTTVPTAAHSGLDVDYDRWRAALPEPCQTISDALLELSWRALSLGTRPTAADLERAGFTPAKAAVWERRLAKHLVDHSCFLPLFAAKEAVVLNGVKRRDFTAMVAANKEKVAQLDEKLCALKELVRLWDGLLSETETAEKEEDISTLEYERWLLLTEQERDFLKLDQRLLAQEAEEASRLTQATQELKDATAAHAAAVEEAWAAELRQALTPVLALLQACDSPSLWDEAVRQLRGTPRPQKPSSPEELQATLSRLREELASQAKADDLRPIRIGA